MTYTGTGVARTVAHSLGSSPGFMIIKRTDTTGNWAVYHDLVGDTNYILLNRLFQIIGLLHFFNFCTLMFLGCSVKLGFHVMCHCQICWN